MNTRRVPGSKRSTIGLVGIVSLLGILGACRATTTYPVGLAWTAHKDGSIVDLVATVHVGKPGSDAWPASVESCWAHAKVLVVEVDLSNVQAVQEAYSRRAILPSSDPPLDSRLPEDLVKRVERRLGARTSWHRFKPWALANLTLVGVLQRWGYHADRGLDTRLIQRARHEGRPILALESAEEQFRIFDDAPFEMQVAYLQATLDDLDSGRAKREVQQLIRALERGELEPLEAALEEFRQREDLAARYFLPRLFQQRHSVMAERIEAHARRHGRCLVAVGALHFVGPDNLLDALRARGFSVERRRLQ